MTARAIPFCLVLLVLLPVGGCIGSVRTTTTDRTATELLLVSSAAERAVNEYDVGLLAARRVFIDTGFFTSVDKDYVVSALRSHLAANGVLLATEREPFGEERPRGAELVLEIRNATLGIWDGDFVLGVPELPVAVPGLPPVLLPPLYAFRRLSQQGYAKFQLWVYEADTHRFVSRSGDLWGRAYYNQWWLLGIGPFVGSNDVYPEGDTFPDWLPGASRAEPADENGEGD